MFICTNRQQRIPALISRYSILRNSKHTDEFEVEILNAEDFEELRKLNGAQFLRGGKLYTWHDELGQSFTFVRFSPPKLMNYQGRAMVMDPDTLVLADIYDLLSRKFNDRDGLACPVENKRSSLMVLDCSKVRWELNKLLDGLLHQQYDYLDLIRLKLEKNFGSYEPEWNHLDTLTDQTKVIHFTNRTTQPWRAGLPIEKRGTKILNLVPKKRIYRLLHIRDKTSYHEENPSPEQRNLWLSYLKEGLAQGVITEKSLRREVKEGHLRKDTFEIIRAS